MIKLWNIFIIMYKQPKYESYLLKLIVFSFVIDKSIRQITWYNNLQTKCWCLNFINWIYLQNTRTSFENISLNEMLFKVFLIRWPSVLVMHLVLHFSPFQIVNNNKTGGKDVIIINMEMSFPITLQINLKDWVMKAPNMLCFNSIDLLGSFLMKCFITLY